MSYPEFFKVIFVCLDDGTTTIVYEKTLFKYWSIREWFALYHLFQKYCKKHGLCRLEITPIYYETY